MTISNAFRTTISNAFRTTIPNAFRTTIPNAFRTTIPNAFRMRILISVLPVVCPESTARGCGGSLLRSWLLVVVLPARGRGFPS